MMADSSLEVLERRGGNDLEIASRSQDTIPMSRLCGEGGGRETSGAGAGGEGDLQVQGKGRVCACTVLREFK